MRAVGTWIRCLFKIFGFCSYHGLRLKVNYYFTNSWFDFSSSIWLKIMKERKKKGGLNFICKIRFGFVILPHLVFFLPYHEPNQYIICLECKTPCNKFNFTSTWVVVIVSTKKRKKKLAWVQVKSYPAENEWRTWACGLSPNHHGSSINGCTLSLLSHQNNSTCRPLTSTLV